jgi:FlaA1/EpsC-like NDP-sugar epimerase
MRTLEGKRVVVTGGTGSLGVNLVRHMLGGLSGTPASIIVFSRDEAKQHAMRLLFHERATATDDIIYELTRDILRFQIGDIADATSVNSVLRRADVVFNAAALKQVPTCEYFPFQAVKTNVMGAENIVQAIREHQLPIEAVVGISTDKACKPVNVMGMSKAIQERIFVQANIECPQTRFVVARYGNVLASRGSVIPLFHEQIQRGGPVTLTSPEMTRFLMSLDEAVDLILAAYRDGDAGDVYVPKLPSTRIEDLARVLIGDRGVETRFVGVRPGEKIHEILVSEEEAYRTTERDDRLVIRPMLAELRPGDVEDDVAEFGREFSSADQLLDRDALTRLLHRHRMMLEDGPVFGDPLAP